MIISRTPFRISFFGGGTDYPAWYREHGGTVLASTIDKYCYLTCRYLPPFFGYRYRIVWSRIEACQTIDEIKHPCVREVLTYLGVERGLDIHHVGDLPARSGMGSSSSFTVGLLNALYALEGRMQSKHGLSTESIYVEQELLKETVGSQDQIQSAYGGLNQISFETDGEFAVKPITLSRERIDELCSHLMLFFTGIERTASKIADSYVNDLQSREPQLRIITEMVSEAISILESGRDISEFGKLLHEGWKAKRSLGADVSNSYVEEIYGQAKSAGAIGGKLLGAGGGGFMLLFVPPSKQNEVKERLKKLICVPFEFESSGSQIIFYDPEIDYSAEDNARLGQQIAPFRELTPMSGEGERMRGTSTG